MKRRLLRMVLRLTRRIPRAFFVLGVLFNTAFLLSAAEIDFDKAREHWSFRPVSNPPIPQVRNSGWPLSSIDSFILARLEKASLRPSPPADKSALIRRATYDLT